METLKDCGVCFFSFDTQKHAPRVLPCGHTLCSQCLVKILSSIDLRKCPFDNYAFTPFHNSLDCFPLNFILLEFLERKNDDKCKVHTEERLKFICLTDKRKLCYGCVKDGEHNGHKVKKIKELRTQGAKVKDELESALLQIKNCEQNKEDNDEKIRKKLINTIDVRCKEIKDIIIEKHFELINHVNNIFSADKQKGSEDTFALKQQLDETIKDITHAFQNDLILLEKTLNSDQKAAKMLSEALEKKSLEVHNRILEMQKSLEQSLNYSKEVVSALQLSSEEVAKEIYSEKDESEFSQIYQKLQTLKFVSHFDVKKTSEGLEIYVWPGQPKPVEVRNGDFKAVEAIDIKLGRYDLLMREETPNLLAYIFRSGLEKLTCLEVSFDSRECNGYLIVWLANIISNSVQYLKSLSLDFENCWVSGGPLRNLHNFVFSKMRNLKDFYLYLNSCQIDAFDLEGLVISLTPFAQNFECFALGLAYNDLTDDDILKVEAMIQNIGGLKNLQLILSGTKITDKGLERFGKNVLPGLRALESFTLCLNKCQISDRGIVRVLKNLPNLKNLELYLSQTQITNKTMCVLSRLNHPLEYLTFIAKNTRVSKKHWEIRDVFIEPIIKIEDY